MKHFNAITGHGEAHFNYFLCCWVVKPITLHYIIFYKFYTNDVVWVIIQSFPRSIEQTMSPQGPFSSCCGAFNLIT